MQDYYIHEDEDSDDQRAIDSSDTDGGDDEDGCRLGNEVSFEQEMQLERRSRVPWVGPASAAAAATAGRFAKSTDKAASNKSDGEKEDEEPFYDAAADDEDEQWMQGQRMQYLAQPRSNPHSKSSRKPVGNTDAVLNCPSCMTLLCLDCQRHETYKSQYRAVFVHNCTTDFGQELLMPPSKGRSKEAAKSRLKNKSPPDEAGTSGGGQTEAAASVNNKYYGVKCDVCSTSVAVYDQDEVYHFFNVLSSHS